VQLHSKQNQNKQCIINSLSVYPVQDQRVSEIFDNFSATHVLNNGNSPQPKHLEKAARKVRVSTTRNHRFTPFACFVTT
jgi:hypothetical protein